MEYPMSYARMVHRNSLQGPGYTHPCPMSGMDVESMKSLLVGDMRRMEADQRDERHLRAYAEKSGASVEQVKAILDMFFDTENWPPFTER